MWNCFFERSYIIHLGFNLSLLRVCRSITFPFLFFSLIFFLEWEKITKSLYVIIIEWHLCHHSSLPTLSILIAAAFFILIFCSFYYLNLHSLHRSFWDLRVSGLIPSWYLGFCFRRTNSTSVSSSIELHRLFGYCVFPFLLQALNLNIYCDNCLGN